MYYAWAEIEQNHLGTALAQAEDAIERDPSLADAYWIRGRVRRTTGSARDAISDLRRALELKPDRVEAWAEMGRCYDELRELSSAIDAYTHAVTAREDNGDWWYRLGRLHLDAGHPSEASRALSRATRLGDTMPSAPGWLADAHRIQGDAMRLNRERAGAIEHYRRYLELAAPDAADRTEVEQSLRELGAD
jgi:tetratricopeptide (TPR) repeat protein